MILTLDTDIPTTTQGHLGMILTLDTDIPTTTQGHLGMIQTLDIDIPTTQGHLGMIQTLDTDIPATTQGHLGMIPTLDTDIPTTTQGHLGMIQTLETDIPATMHGQFGMIQTRDSCPGNDAFIKMVYLQCCLVVTLLAPCETAAIWRTLCVHLTVMHQFIVSLQSKPHTLGACVFKCHLHFWQNDQNHLHAMLYHWGGTDTEMRVNNKS